VAEIGSDRSGIDAIVDELVAAGVPEQVRVDIVEADAGGSATQHFEEAACRHW